jgi:transcriptional regulator with XRE-family HTH domain
MSREGISMSIVDMSSSALGAVHHLPVPNVPAPDAPSQFPVKPLQRVAVVRRQQGISRRTLARRMNVELSTVREQESDTYDMTLSQLYEWQKALEVPVTELLVEADDNLTANIMLRAQLVRLMKSALAIQENARQESILRMVETLINQLLEIMPELSGVGPWHVVGKRRRLDELGAAADRLMSESVFLDLTE